MDIFAVVLCLFDVIKLEVVHFVEMTTMFLPQRVTNDECPGWTAYDFLVTHCIDVEMTF